MTLFSKIFQIIGIKSKIVSSVLNSTIISPYNHSFPQSFRFKDSSSSKDLTSSDVAISKLPSFIALSSCKDLKSNTTTFLKASIFYCLIFKQEPHLCHRSFCQGFYISVSRPQARTLTSTLLHSYHRR